MLGHPGGEEHSRYLIELSFLPPPARWLDMGAGDVCGCMAAGSCMISWFTGKPDADSFESSHHKAALGEFTKWFTEEMELEYMSIDCRDIVGTNPAKKVQYCPGIIAATYEKCVEILESRGLL